jgi:hypothetical protein
MKPTFLPDRYPKAALKQNYPLVFECLNEKGILEGKNELVRFVGVVNSGPSQNVVFLPHGAPHDLENDGEEFAREVMAAVTKFAKQNSRTDEENEGEKTLSFSALLAAIAEDFRDNGLFSERLRTRSINSGKPNWPATIKGQISLHTSNGAPVFTDISTTRPVSSNLNILAIVQAYIVQEIFGVHSWWMAENFGRRTLPFDIDKPRYPREAWSGMLRGIRRNLFAERPLRLVAMLIAYLEHAPESSDGATVCGVSDFSTVWETMLRKVIPGVEDSWNKRLPDPRFVHIDGTPQRSGEMRSDIVINNGDRIIIADAKYYKADRASNAPGWSDIVKQFYYVEALATVQGAPPRDKIGNCFIFPIEDHETGKLRRVEMFGENNRPVGLFPSIDCIYIGTRNVINSYCKGRHINRFDDYNLNY